MKKEEKPDLFQDERIVIILRGEREGVLGKINIVREISGPTAKKILKLLSKPTQTP